MNIQTKRIYRFFAVLLCAACTLLLPAQALAVSNQSLAVPLFQTPNQGAMWNDVTAAGSGSVPFVVANTNTNGPGTAVNPVYTAAIAKASAAGIRTLGYVQVNYQNRTFSQVYSDVNAWYGMYPGISGVYVDLVQEGTTSDLCYAAALYSHIKNLHPNDLVVLNMGGNVSQAYEPYGDIFVNADTDYGSYQNWSPLYKNFEDNPNYQNRFWHIIYNVSQNNYSSAFSEVRNNNAGWVYITNQDQPNPFSATPSYWQNEASDVNAVPASSIPNRGLTTLPRGCISLSSSATSTIDTTTAKQTTVTSAITVNNTDTTYASDPTTKLEFLTLPKSVSISSISGSGWSCSGSSCADSTALPPASSSSLNATLTAVCGYSGGNATLRLLNYAGNRWDLTIPVKAPVGCTASSGGSGQVTTLTTQSVETTPSIAPLNGDITSPKSAARPAVKHSLSLAKVLIIGVIAADLLFLAVWGGIKLYQRRNPYKIR